MTRHLLLAAMLATLLGGVSTDAANPRQQPKKAGKGPAGQPPAGASSADQLPAGKYTGMVQAVSGEEHTLTLKMEYQKIDVNPQALQRLNASTQRQYQQVLRLQQQLQQEMMRPGRNHNVAATVQRLQRAMAQLQATQMRGGKGVAKATPASAEVAFPLTPDVKVRLQQPAEELDDKGNVKKYSPAQLRTMKGKYPDLPGYPTTLNSLEKDQQVQLTLVRVQKLASRPTKDTPRPIEDADPDGPADKNARPPVGREHRMQVSVILILNGKTDPPAASPKR